MAMNLQNYNQDEAYRLAAQRIGYGQEAPTYAGTYENQLSDLYDKIANREKFSYDVNADPLYQAYKDNYIQQGKLAMKDTMGQAAALTGGYGNTYGQQVGQQAYDAYLQNLSAVIPELYGMAYDQYRDEGDDLKDLYGMLGDRVNTEYGRYRDLVSDYNVNRSLVQQQEATDYSRLLNDDEREYERGLTADETAYNRQQASYKNLLALISATGYSPSDAELAAAGLTREAADALIAEYQRQVALQGGYGSGGGGGGGGSAYSYDDRSGWGADTIVLPEGMSPGDYYALQDAAQQAASASTGSIGSNDIYYPAVKEQQIREQKQQELGRMPTAGEVGWNDTAAMLAALGITGSTPTTVNQYGEVRSYDANGNAKPTRGEVQRAADAALRNGEISNSEYRTILKGIH